MTIIVEQFKAILGVDVEPGTEKSLNDLEGSLDEIISGFGKMAAAAGAAVAALLTATTITNAHTAVQTNLANALGISAEAMETYGFLLGAIGMDAESVIKTMRVLNDRIGELSQGAKASDTLKRAVKELNLEFKDLKDLSPEKQFEAILQAAQDAEDGQLAMSMATELLGREGIKMVGWVRNQTQSVAELLEMQRQMNLQTDEGRMGAVRMTAAMDNLGAITESTWALFSGLVGDAIAPLVEAFNAWVAANRELIQTKLKEWAEGFGRLINWLVPKVRTVINVITRLWQRIDKFIKSTIGWERFIKILGAAFGAMLAILAVAGLLKFIIGMGKLIKALKAMKLSILGPIALLAAFLLILEDVYVFLEGGESVTGKFLAALGEYLGLDLVTPIREAWPAIKAFFTGMGEVFVQWWTSVVQGLTAFVMLNMETLGNLVRFIVDIFTKGLGPAWDIFVKRMEETWHSFAEGVKSIFSEVVDFVLDKLGDLAGPVKSVLGGIGKFLGIDVGVGAISGNIGKGASVAASRGGAANNTSNTKNQTTNVGGITINQQPGQSAAGLARKVRREIQTMAAGALRSNSKGIDY